MQQDIVVPQKTIKHLIEEIRLNISDPTKVISQAIVFQVDDVTQQKRPWGNVIVGVNDLLATEVTAGNLTAANITGFKKCMKAICAKTLSVDFTTANDAL